MDSVRVLIVSDSSMFGHGLQSLLISQAEVEILGGGTNINQAIEQIETLRPDVVIWGDSGMKRDSGWEEILLTAKPGLKIISLSLQNNEIVIYQSVRKMAQDLQDLIEAVKI